MVGRPFGKSYPSGHGEAGTVDTADTRVVVPASGSADRPTGRPDSPVSRAGLNRLLEQEPVPWPLAAIIDLGWPAAMVWVSGDRMPASSMPLTDQASSSTASTIPVLVVGALGRMGAHVVRAVAAAADLDLVAAVDTAAEAQGQDIGSLLGLGALDVAVSQDLEGHLCLVSQQHRGAVMVDFTHPAVVYDHTRAAIAYGVHPVIGTTGLSPEQLDDLADFSRKASVGAAVIPNFSVGMVLLQQAAVAAARFYDHAELVELHHNGKADAPSGTCIKTAELLEAVGKIYNPTVVEEKESLAGSRGGQRPSGLRLHALRLPGLVAHQEVIFGGPGETYTLRHDTMDRSAYMPGVLKTIRQVGALEGLVYGLEHLL